MAQWFPAWDRQFDNVEGGGFADQLAADGTWNWTPVPTESVLRDDQGNPTEKGPWLPEEIDTSIKNQFDDTPGGGFADNAAESIDPFNFDGVGMKLLAVGVLLIFVNAFAGGAGEGLTS